MSFTPEELAAMAEADAQIEAEFELTYEEVQLSRELDAYAVWQRSSWEEIERRKRGARNKQSREHQKQYQRAYYQRTKQRCIARKSAWYRANKGSILAQQKAYKAKRKELYHAREELQEAPPSVLDGHD